MSEPQFSHLEADIPSGESRELILTFSSSLSTTIRQYLDRLGKAVLESRPVGDMP